ncbi:unnamed protein product [Wuchereria bancrofti]|uniref:RING-type domain-containing protein n=1 Tax=Wuchereria bancrofti TaxID=6293 RepID=A0A183Y5P9_WUCBA|nr:unnamed protein product [Wuchereria bancrofti]
MLNCPICLEADDGLFGFAALKCGHVFHRHCISSWLAIDKNTKICPVCRKFADSFLKNKKKFSTHQQTTTHQYELRSISHISNTSNPYWLRIRRS